MYTWVSHGRHTVLGRNNDPDGTTNSRYEAGLPWRTGVVKSSVKSNEFYEPKLPKLSTLSIECFYVSGWRNKSSLRYLNFFRLFGLDPPYNLCQIRYHNSDTRDLNGIRLDDSCREVRHRTCFSSTIPLVTPDFKSDTTRKIRWWSHGPMETDLLLCGKRVNMFPSYI